MSTYDYPPFPLFSLEFPFPFVFSHLGVLASWVVSNHASIATCGYCRNRILLPMLVFASIRLCICMREWCMEYHICHNKKKSAIMIQDRKLKVFENSDANTQV